MSKRPSTTTGNPHAASAANAANDVHMPIIFNPVSKWQEYVEVPGLTLFDVHRRPFRPPVDAGRIKMNLKVCVYCVGIIKLLIYVH